MKIWVQINEIFPEKGTNRKTYKKIHQKEQPEARSNARPGTSNRLL